MEDKKPMSELDWELIGVTLSAVALFVGYMRYRAKAKKLKGGTENG
jgi:hypothetical protein